MSALSVRRIEVSARGADNQLLPGAEFTFESNGTKLGEARSTDGHASIELESRDIAVTVTVLYGGKSQSCNLSSYQDDWTFRFGTTSSTFLRAHFPALLGCLLLLLTIALAFAQSNQNALQIRIILAVLALAGGLIATEIPGLLHANVTFGEKVAIIAGGALAVFVILFLTVPA